MKINGNEITNKLIAGVGNPIKESDFESYLFKNIYFFNQFNVVNKNKLKILTCTSISKETLSLSKH